MARGLLPSGDSHRGQKDGWEDIYSSKMSCYRPGGVFKHFAVAEVPDFYRNHMGGVQHTLGSPRYYI